MAYELPLAEQNLAAMWRNYTAVGHSRLVYVNTAAVFEPVIASLTQALGDDPSVCAVLLTAAAATAAARLTQREIGSGAEEHLRRGAAMAARLERAAPPSVHRVPTDGRTVVEAAGEIAALCGRLDQHPRSAAKAAHGALGWIWGRSHRGGFAAMSRRFVCVVPYDDENEGIHLNEGQVLTLLRILREDFEVWAITDETGAIPLTAFRFCCRPAGEV